jgi:RNA polymerase sigma factor (sigma-70 family)
MPERRLEHEVSPARAFATTHWSVVLQSGQDESPAADAALEKLCRAYWPPIYFFLRRKGYGPEESEDLTQGFFTGLLRKTFFRCADRTKGRFRSYLLGALDHFLAREWTKSRREKRGGKLTLLSLDEPTPEDRYRLEPADNSTPETIFARQWALAVLEQAMARLRADCAACGKTQAFEALKGVISGEPGTESYAEIGRRLGMTDGAVKVAAHRMRHCYAEFLREEIAQTVATRQSLAASTGGPLS